MGAVQRAKRIAYATECVPINERDARILSLLGEGLKLGDIGKKLNLSRESIRLRVAKCHPQQKKLAWRVKSRVSHDKEKRVKTISGLSDIGRQRLSYDPETGLISWLDPGPDAFATLKGYRIFKRNFCGKTAGSISPDGYVKLRLNGASLLAHRVIWAMVYGYDPVDDIDHRDMCRSNNRIGNLRQATRSQNCMNKLTRSDNTSGSKGVSWHKVTGKWSASICVDGHAAHLGVFTNKQDATRAYQEASAEVHGNFSPTRLV